MNTNGTSKIKILVLSPSLVCGGSEKFIMLLCNNIDKQKFDVTVAVLNNEDPFYTIKDFTVIDLKVKHVRSGLFKLMRLVKLHQPDIIFSNSNHLNLYLAIFKSWFSKKVFFIAQESSIVSVNSKRAKFAKLYNWLLKKYYHRLDCIICQSEYMQQDLVANYNVNKGKTTVINNPVEEQPPITIAPEQDKFISVARLSEEKGLDRLIRSVAKLAVPFTYYIIGDGDQKQLLQNLINSLQLQDKVFLNGKSNTPFAGMENASIFLMGSHYEGFPNAVLEANALGIPVVAFDVPGGIQEIILPPINGLLVNDGDETAFAQAIEKALQIGFDREQVQTLTKQKFSVNFILGQYEALFVSVYGKIK